MHGTDSNQRDQQGADQRQTFWDKIWKDQQGKITIYQRPNLWIILWAIMDVTAIVAPSRKVADIAWIIGTTALVVWALLELVRGVNYFRRGLGLLILLVTIASIFRIGL